MSARSVDTDRERGRAVRALINADLGPSSPPPRPTRDKCGMGVDIISHGGWRQQQHQQQHHEQQKEKKSEGNYYTTIELQLSGMKCTIA